MKKGMKCILITLVMLLLILDTKNVRSATYDGIELCIRSVIPSLFPLLIIGKIFTVNLQSIDIPLLKPLYSLCKIPQNCGQYLIVGLCGGYPVGAKCIRDGYDAGIITKETGHRLLGFCNNAGPAFVFGVIGTLFAHRSVPWIIWGIHIFTAIITGMLLPVNDKNEIAHISEKSKNYDILLSCIKTMAIICTWVILFKIILAFICNWLLIRPHSSIYISISGITELTNGCIELSNIENQGLRFILATTFLSFGGLCVAMQTISVTRGIGSGFYLKGKLIQTLLSAQIACIVQHFLFSYDDQISLPYYIWITSIILLCITLFHTWRKKF